MTDKKLDLNINELSSTEDIKYRKLEFTKLQRKLNINISQSKTTKNK